jgi:IPT/TIG domain
LDASVLSFCPKVGKTTESLARSRALASRIDALKGQCVYRPGNYAPLRIAEVKPQAVTAHLDWWIALALFAGNLLLLGPWIFSNLSNEPWNNGYIYVGIARLFRDHPWTWNSLQYGGAPFRYLYPPIFPILISLIPGMSLGRAFHLVTGLSYAVTPVCLYVLGRALFRSRMPSLFAAIAYSVFPSPAYLTPQWHHLAQPYAQAPWGFLSVIGYEEAAHTFAFPVILLAVTAAWSNRWKLAAVLTGVVFLINWPALIGLGFAMAAIGITRARSQGPMRSIGYIAGIVGAGYGLSAFWMTPGYFVSSTLLNRIVLRHTLHNVPWSLVSWTILACVLAAIALCLWRRTPAALAFTGSWAALAGLVVVSYTVAGNYLLPSPHRYMLEFNCGLVLFVAGIISSIPSRRRTAVAALLLLLGTALSLPFLTHSWKLEPPEADPQSGVAYQMAEWLKRHAAPSPGAMSHAVVSDALRPSTPLLEANLSPTFTSRVFASGELDSTLNLWADVPQVGGTGQDISNFLIFAAERQAAFGCEADAGRIRELWLRALNAATAVVHHSESREHFHWYSEAGNNPALPVVWDNGAGDTVARLPDFRPNDAVVVDLRELSRLPRLDSTANAAALAAYVSWAEGKRPLTVHWKSEADAAFDVDLTASEAVLVKMNNDPGWRASQASIENDPIGFQLIHAEPGRRHITLQFGASWDTWLGRGITLLTALLLLAGVRGIWIGAFAVLPAIGSWLVLMAAVPPTARIAEDTFVRVRPPLINPMGIVDARTFAQPPFAPGALVSIYGMNLGAPTSSVQVWMGGRALNPVFHGPNLVNVRLPEDAPGLHPISVEVNGCRGNSYSVATR